jgi:hypothetical protein
MFTYVRAHWAKISTALVFATFLGIGGMKAYEHFSGDCCAPGSSCCHPGASCCHGKQPVAQR